MNNDLSLQALCIAGPELHKLNPQRSIEDAGHLHDNLWSFPFGFGHQ
jgi:hypothetical protein